MKPRVVEISSSQEVEKEGTIYTVQYDATGNMSYFPAQTSGPVEHCYPDESECDLSYKITSVFLGTMEFLHTDPAFLESITELLDEEKIEEELWESYHSGG